MPLRSLILAAAILATPARAETPLPFDIGGGFDLVDQTGTPRGEASLHGEPAMIFFGYASCQAICSVALPRMAEAVDLLADQGTQVQPVLITVDPVRDTPEALAEAAPSIHPRLVALTGSAEALAEARAAFKVESKPIGEDIQGPIFAHGSFIYLMGADGELLTLLPPVLGSERIAEIARKYLGASD